jgi:hypothetical protein
MASSKTTIDHNEIREWAESRGGQPSSAGGVLRIDFDEPAHAKAKNDNDSRLEPITWDKFFEIFEDRELAFLYQEETANGKESRFNKFVDRGQMEE